jgi:ribosome-associated translation inhibitor RaiA
MEIEIRQPSIESSPSLETYARQRVRAALGRLRHAVQRVRVFLHDLNGPRGGPDKQCAVEVQLRGRPSLRVEDVRADPYAAVDAALARAGQVLGRRTGRDKKPGRQSVRKPGLV